MEREKKEKKYRMAHLHMKVFNVRKGVLANSWAWGFSVYIIIIIGMVFLFRGVQRINLFDLFVVFICLQILIRVPFWIVGAITRPAYRRYINRNYSQQQDNYCGSEQNNKDNTWGKNNTYRNSSQNQSESEHQNAQYDGSHNDGRDKAGSSAGKDAYSSDSQNHSEGRTENTQHSGSQHDGKEKAGSSAGKDAYSSSSQNHSEGRTENTQHSGSQHDGKDKAGSSAGKDKDTYSSNSQNHSENNRSGNTQHSGTKNEKSGTGNSSYYSNGWKSRATSEEEKARQLLGLKETFTSEELKKAWRRELKKCHPDQNVNSGQEKNYEERTKRINLAYELLLKKAC